MDLKKARADKLAQAKALIDEGKVDEADALMTEVKGLNEQIKAAERGSDLLRQIGELGGEKDGDARDQGLQEQAATIGEHFAKSGALDQMKANIGRKGYSVAAPEWNGPAKAATDNHSVGSVFQTPVLTTFDRTIVRANRPDLVLTDLLGTGTIDGNAIQYFVEAGPVEGAFTTVAEAGAKPQLHIPDPTTAIDSLRKIAGFIKFTDEMLEDLAFVVTEINNRLLYELAKFEETQLFYGNGTGTNILGLMNRSGVQVLTKNSGESTPDAIFRAMTSIYTASGLTPDGIAMHPLDYQKLRLLKDANDQYMGGGFFQGQYGNGGILTQPPVWGLRTVVTPSITQGTALIGAFQSATVYRKGGLRVESTNSHASDFTNNLVTVRAEERIALAVRRPSAFAKLDLTDVP
jgi:HK97 family phage major capsid protein